MLPDKQHHLAQVHNEKPYSKITFKFQRVWAKKLRYFLNVSAIQGLRLSRQASFAHLYRNTRLWLGEVERYCVLAPCVYVFQCLVAERNMQIGVEYVYPVAKRAPWRPCVPGMPVRQHNATGIRILIKRIKRTILLASLAVVNFAKYKSTAAFRAYRDTY